MTNGSYVYPVLRNITAIISSWKCLWFCKLMQGNDKQGLHAFGTNFRSKIPPGDQRKPVSFGSIVLDQQGQSVWLFLSTTRGPKLHPRSFKTFRSSISCASVMNQNCRLIGSYHFLSSIMRRISCYTNRDVFFSIQMHNTVLALSRMSRKRTWTPSLCFLPLHWRRHRRLLA